MSKSLGTVARSRRSAPSDLSVLGGAFTPDIQIVRETQQVIYNPEADFEPLYPHYCRRVGISRAHAFRKAATGEIKTLLFGRRRLVDVRASLASMRQQKRESAVAA